MKKIVALLTVGIIGMHSSIVLPGQGQMNASGDWIQLVGQITALIANILALIASYKYGSNTSRPPENQVNRRSR